jgi:hypothetical protein
VAVTSKYSAETNVRPFFIDFVVAVFDYGMDRILQLEKKLDLQAEHGIDSSARGLGRRRSAFKRRKRRLLGGWGRCHRLLHVGRLILAGHRS